jgi:hypothetical protein
MQSVCYAWDDTPFAWMDAPFTWAEGCIIKKLINNVIGPPRRGIKSKIRELKKEEKQTIIELFVRLQVDELVFETRINKHKNKKVKIKLKDVKMAMTEPKNINLNVKINN